MSDLDIRISKAERIRLTARVEPRIVSIKPVLMVDFTWRKSP